MTETETKEYAQDMSRYLGMAVRNAMENFHGKHLSDAQMAELNPIIRNALYTALYAMHTCDSNQKASDYVDFQLKCIPDYWEASELSKDLK